MENELQRMCSKELISTLVVVIQMLILIYQWICRGLHVHSPSTSLRWFFSFLSGWLTFLCVFCMSPLSFWFIHSLSGSLLLVSSPTVGFIPCGQLTSGSPTVQTETRHQAGEHRPPNPRLWSRAAVHYRTLWLYSQPKKYKRSTTPKAHFWTFTLIVVFQSFRLYSDFLFCLWDFFKDISLY